MLNKENLYKAIELAEGPEQCKYVVDGKPCCVVAQYLVLEGLATVEEMETDAWKTSDGKSDASIEDCPIDDKLRWGDINILGTLQEMWDINSQYVESCKSNMKQYIQDNL